MTLRAKSICSYPACGKLIDKAGRCDKHQVIIKRQAYERRDKSTQRLYGSRWRALRAHVLKNEPLCRECRLNGVLRAATEVDHIKAHKGDEHLFYEQSNLQPLCVSCHSRKTASEDGGFGNRIREGINHAPR